MTFSVYLYFMDDSELLELANVSAEEACQCVRRVLSRVATRVGLVKMIRIIDSTDDINFEWQFGRGQTFPFNPENN